MKELKLNVKRGFMNGMKYQSDAINELASALAKAQAEMQHAKKSAENPFFKSNYADLPAVIDAAKPFLTKHGLSVSQPITTDEQGNIAVMTMLMHASGQWLLSNYPVRPVKNDPQGVGSAITYARRYSYAAITGVAAMDEDDDGNDASGHNHDKGKPEQSRAEYKPTDPVRPHKDAYVVACPIKADGTLDFDTFVADLESKVTSAKNMNELSLWNRANAKTLTAMQKERPDLFNAFGEEYKKMANALM